jgi:hypothetical protein
MSTLKPDIAAPWQPIGMTPCVAWRGLVHFFKTSFVVVILALLAISPIKADEHVALVAGNSNTLNIAQLDKPRKDANHTADPPPQWAVLYDEDPSNPRGEQYVGSVVWRTEIVKTAGQPDDVAVHADIDIPPRKLKVTMSLKRNLDKSLPATHVIELTFSLPPDFVGGGVSNVPGILMKANERARGTPLAGLGIKVSSGLFLVGLSNVATDHISNLRLLLKNAWLDIPLVYSNQRRAIIAIEKGDSGEQVFKKAFKAWGQYPAPAAGGKGR